jgi:hypothetical protein
MKCVLFAWILAAFIPLHAEVTAPLMKVGSEDLPSIGFDLLASYPYKIVDLGNGATPEEIEVAKKTDQVPVNVKAYDGKRVVLTGYMMPLKMDKGLSVSFILMKDVTTCCYGATPSMNDYLIVTMRGKGVEAVQDVPVQVSGTLSIRQTYEDGYIVSLYTLEGEKFLGVKK